MENEKTAQEQLDDDAWEQALSSEDSLAFLNDISEQIKNTNTEDLPPL